MTPEEKVIHYIRKDLIDKYGIGFIALSEKKQNLIICDTLRELFEQHKKGDA